MAGCGKPSDKKKDDAHANNSEAANNKPEDIAVGVAGGSNKRMGDWTNPVTKESKRVTLWEISWESAAMQRVDAKPSGTMFKVQGKTYAQVPVPGTKTTEEKVASTFSADQAEADKVANRLLIQGNVRVTSLVSPEAVMTAKKVEWFPDLKMFKASGDVLIESKTAVVGPAKELYVSPELKRIGTSQDYFKKQNTKP